MWGDVGRRREIWRYSGSSKLLRGAKVGEALACGVDVEEVRQLHAELRDEGALTQQPEAHVVCKRPRRRVALGVACTTA